MGGDGRDSHLACCTTAPAAKAESPPPAGRGSDGLDGDRQAGARASRRGATGAPEFRSRAPQGRRARRLRGLRETGTLGARRAKTPAEGVASGRRRDSRRLVGAAPARRLPLAGRGDERGT
jgi:hypothetical protein